MTFGQGTRSALFGAFIGLLFAGLFHSICTLTDLVQLWTWIVKAVLILIGAVLWLGYKILQERVLLKDYEKMVAERQRRMR